jgi:hypothetical protein
MAWGHCVASGSSVQKKKIVLEVLNILSIQNRVILA